jgi:Uncharacterised nucleotidyltransferase
VTESREPHTPIIDDAFRWNLLQKKAQDVRVGRAFSFFRQHGIEPILIKGWAAGRVYPPDKFRDAIDIDLAVSESDYRAAHRLNRSEPAQGLAVDLHRELRHLDTLDWDDLFTNSQLIETGSGLARVLRPEDHLRVLCVHWLTNGGADKARLWDIRYAVENRPDDFDWSRCLGSVSPKRRRWIACTIGLAAMYVDLDIDELPIAAECRDVPQWMVRTVEQEWGREIKLQPLEVSLYDRKLLISQVKRRLNPNPIYATVSMEGSLDARTRFFYQVGNFFQRALPSIRRVSASLRNK